MSPPITMGYIPERWKKSVEKGQRPTNFIEKARFKHIKVKEHIQKKNKAHSVIYYNSMVKLRSEKIDHFKRKSIGNAEFIDCNITWTDSILVDWFEHFPNWSSLMLQRLRICLICAMVSSGLVTVWPIVLESSNISWSFPPWNKYMIYSVLNYMIDNTS